jgi:hypothetical protein
MARPAQPLRLASLDPHAVAVEVCAELVARIQAAAEPLRPAKVILSDEDPTRLAQRSEIGLAVAALVRYAKWGGDAVLARALLAEVSSTLGVDPDREPLSNPLGLALIAAQGRVRLARGKAVTAREIAVLGGVDPKALRLLVRRGELEAAEREGGELLFSARAAREWLEGRG